MKTSKGLRGTGSSDGLQGMEEFYEHIIDNLGLDEAYQLCLTRLLRHILG